MKKLIQKLFVKQEEHQVEKWTIERCGWEANARRFDERHKKIIK